MKSSTSDLTTDSVLACAKHFLAQEDRDRRLKVMLSVVLAVVSFLSSLFKSGFSILESVDTPLELDSRSRLRRGAADAPLGVTLVHLSGLLVLLVAVSSERAPHDDARRRRIDLAIKMLFVLVNVSALAKSSMALVVTARQQGVSIFATTPTQRRQIFVVLAALELVKTLQARRTTRLAELVRRAHLRVDMS